MSLFNQADNFSISPFPSNTFCEKEKYGVAYIFGTVWFYTYTLLMFAEIVFCLRLDLLESLFMFGTYIMFLELEAMSLTD